MKATTIMASATLALATVIPIQATETAPAGKLYREFTFDNWEWIPIKQSVGKQIKALMDKGEDAPVDIDGALLNHPVGLDPLVGFMVEEKDARKGKALRVKNLSRNRVFGFHSGIKIESKKDYSYSVWLKGKGVFRFMVWRQAVNEKGEKKMIGWKPLIQVKLNTDKWTQFTGEFKMPVNENTEFKIYEDKQPTGIFIDCNQEVWIDEFQVFVKE